MSPMDSNGSWIVVALIIWPETKSCSSMIIFHILLRSKLPSVTPTRVNLLVWVRLQYRRTNTLIRLCLSNHLVIISCQYQSYVIWVCLLVLFSASRCVVFSQDDYTFVFEGFRKGDLYIVDFSSGPAVSTCLMEKLHLVGYGIKDLVMQECEIFKF